MKRRRAPRSSHSRGAARRKSNRQLKVTEKLLKAAYAKGQAAKVNYLIDALHEAGAVDSWMDKLLHLYTEMKLGKGTPEERLDKFLKKVRRYKR